MARGRKSSYKPEHAEQAYKQCLLGAVDAELIECLGISETTLYEWKKRYPEFREAIRRGKEQADSDVAHAVYQTAVGHTIREWSTDPDGNVRVTEKQVPGNPAAQRYWLNNRTRGRERPWADRQEIEKTEQITITHVDSRELARRTMALLDIARREGSVIDVPVSHQVTKDAED